jgi:integrase
MAFLVKDVRGRSPYWYAVYSVIESDGRRRWVRKSTKKQNRYEAKELLDAWQAVADKAAAGRLDEARMREVVRETIERVTGKKMNSLTVAEWLDQWIRSEDGAVAPHTLVRYRQVVRDFLGCISRGRADAPLETLSPNDILAFRDDRLAGGRARRTVNQTLKILKRPFKLAVDQGLIVRNPVAAVRSLRDRGARKETFDPEQIRQLLDVATGDWKGLILAGYFTGGRLTDLARLQWRDVDLVKRTITFTQRKTGAEVVVPIHPDLLQYLLSLPGVDNPTKPVFPTLFNKPEAGKSGLSMTFKAIMKRAGIADGVARQKDGKLGRNVSALSFHSLRHSFTSAMAAANVPAEIRQKLTGHADPKSHAVYTHHELETVRHAIESISRLPGKT